jgi:hypothetical protein
MLTIVVNTNLSLLDKTAKVNFLKDWAIQNKMELDTDKTKDMWIHERIYEIMPSPSKH